MELQTVVGTERWEGSKRGFMRWQALRQTWEKASWVVVAQVGGMVTTEGPEMLLGTEHRSGEARLATCN